MDALSDAYAALGEAISKVAETYPNGRDYYVQEPGAIFVAQDEHYARMRKLAEVREEIDQMREAIDRQGER